MRLFRTRIKPVLARREGRIHYFFGFSDIYLKNVLVVSRKRKRAPTRIVEDRGEMNIIEGLHGEKPANA